MLFCAAEAYGVFVKGVNVAPILYEVVLFVVLELDELVDEPYDVVLDLVFVVEGV